MNRIMKKKRILVGERNNNKLYEEKEYGSKDI